MSLKLLMKQFDIKTEIKILKYIIYLFYFLDKGLLHKTVYFKQ